MTQKENCRQIPSLICADSYNQSRTRDKCQNAVFWRYREWPQKQSKKRANPSSSTSKNRLIIGMKEKLDWHSRIFQLLRTVVSRSVFTNKMVTTSFKQFFQEYQTYWTCVSIHFHGQLKTVLMTKYSTPPLVSVLTSRLASLPFKKRF